MIGLGLNNLSYSGKDSVIIPRRKKSGLAGVSAGSFFGNCILFDGVNDYCNRNSVTDFDAATSIDVAMWIFIDSSFINAQNTAFEWMNAAVNSGFRVAIRYNAGNSFVRIICCDGTSAIGNTPNGSFLYGQWNFVVAKFIGSGVGNSGRLKCKINDVAQTLSFTGTIPAAMASPSNNLRFGIDFSGSSNQVKGKLDHCGVKINSNWSDAEDTVHYNLGLGASYTSPDHLWLMDENNPSTNVPDTGGVGGLDLTMINFNPPTSGWVDHFA